MLYSQTRFNLRNCRAAFKELCRCLLALKGIKWRHYKEVFSDSESAPSLILCNENCTTRKYLRGQSLVHILLKPGIWVSVFGVVWFLIIINWREMFTGWWAVNTKLLPRGEICKLGTERRPKHSADSVWVSKVEAVFKKYQLVVF